MSGACGNRAVLMDSLENRDLGLSAFNSIYSTCIIMGSGRSAVFRRIYVMS